MLVCSPGRFRRNLCFLIDYIKIAILFRRIKHATHQTIGHSALCFTFLCGLYRHATESQKSTVGQRGQCRKKYVAPPPPKKHIELKEVQDNNYSPEYMYPDDKYKKQACRSQTGRYRQRISGKSGSKYEQGCKCIAMIGQEKFDKYTEMYGSEAASIKRCTLLKSMQKS